jgi:radical SAM protein with 4Fe4S-binding SPASM domain
MFRKKTLHSVVWEITLKCNAKCLHCGSTAGLERKNELSTEEALRICDELAENGCKKANIIGGELFLRPDWQQILKRLTDKGVGVSVITNAIALNEEKINLLKDLQIKSLGISIDGGKSETHDYIRQVPGLFDKIFNLTQYIDSANLNAVAVTTLSKFNIFELELLRKKLADSSFKAWQIQLASPHGRMNNDFVLDLFEYYISGLFFARSRIKTPMKELAIHCNHDFGYFSKTIPIHAAYTKWMGCCAGKGILGIRSDGKVQGCLSIYEDEFTEGDLTRQSLKEIWNSRKFCAWNKRAKRFLSLKGFCKTCEYALICLAGCSDIAYSKTGTVKENPQCYHAIESFWKKAAPQNEFEEVFKALTQGYMDETGIIHLKSGEILTKDFVENFNIDDNRKKLLNLISDELTL